MSTTRSPTVSRVETDARALMTSVAKVFPYLVLFAALIAGALILVLERATPLYRAEATILVGIDDSDQAAARGVLAGEIQLIRSRDIARGVIESLGLADTPEYREAATRESVVDEILFALGLSHAHRDGSSEERVLAHFDDRLETFAMDGSPVIVIAFHAADPELAARGANAVADAYLALRRSAVAGAAEALAAEIERLRRVLAEAEARMSALKDEAAGAPSPLTAAERAALVAERDAVRDAARKAEDDAAAIREALRAGNVLSLVPVREDSAVMRLLDEQHSVVEEIAKEMATIPLGNPRVAELRARLSEIDAEIEAAARRMADALAADAEAALARVAEIEQRLDASDVATRRQAEIAALEETVVETRGLLDAALRRQEGTGQNGVVPSDVRLLTRATVPAAPVWPDTMGLTLLAFVAALVLGAVAVVLREFASGRAFREVPFEPLADLEQPAPAAGRFRRIEDEGVPRAMPEEPTLAPAVETSEASLGAVADGVAGRRRIVVALAEGSDSDGRPLAAVALARALSARDRTVVLVDLHADGADSIAMGEAPGLPGFADLLAGDVSFAQVIFRDRRSRAHFIPAGLNPIKAEALSGERLATLLTALDHTYDHVVIDCPDDAISRIAPGADAALVASEHASVDPRTVRAVARIAKVSAARIFHLIVDPARRSPEPEAAAA